MHELCVVNSNLITFNISLSHTESAFSFPAPLTSMRTIHEHVSVPADGESNHLERSSLTQALLRASSPMSSGAQHPEQDDDDDDVSAVDDARIMCASPLTVEERSAKRKRYFTVALITLTSMFLYADQNLIGPNLTAIANEFNLSDEQKDVRLGGWLQLAFFVVGSPASLIIGYYADKTKRVRLFFWTTLIGEGPCLATYWVKTYWQLFALRAMTGIAVGGCLPLLFSLCGDLFASSERSYVASFLTIATGAGVALGQVVAGTVGPAYGWRLPFIITSVPAVVLAAVMYAVVDEPTRGAQEEEVHRRSMKRTVTRVDGEASIASETRQEDMTLVSYTAKMNWIKVRKQLFVRTNLLVLLQGLPGTVPWGVFNSYFVDYLHVQKGMEVQIATAAITVFGLGSAVGTIIGGVVGQRIYNRKKSQLPLLLGSTTALGALPAYYYLNVNNYGPGRVGLYLTCLVGGVLCSITPPNVRAILLNVNPPETRGSMFAFYSQIDDVGKGGGPALVAGLIVGFGRTVAFNIAFSFWFLCGILLVCITFTIDRDVQSQEKMVLDALNEDVEEVEGKTDDSRRADS